MNRRDLLVALTGSTLLPKYGYAQQDAPLIGWLSAGGLSGQRNFVITFRSALAEEGFIEGRNLSMEFHWADGQLDRLPRLANDLIKRRPAVIIATGVTSALAIKSANANVPLLFFAGDDPVKLGIVTSLSRPEGGATGVAWLTSELIQKRVELLRELLPQRPIIGFLVNPSGPEMQPQLEEMRAAAARLGQPIRVASVVTERELDKAFLELGSQGVSALIVSNDPYFNTIRNAIVARAAHHNMAAMYDRREWVTAGGLISYGTSHAQAYRHLGSYAAKILKGVPTADLPIERAAKFDLVINLNAARAIGIEMPESFLLRADEVIE
jgi:putative ABC transport system substrate-binding protein